MNKWYILKGHGNDKIQIYQKIRCCKCTEHKLGDTSVNADHSCGHKCKKFLTYKG